MKKNWILIDDSIRYHQQRQGLDSRPKHALFSFLSGTKKKKNVSKPSSLSRIIQRH